MCDYTANVSRYVRSGGGGGGGGDDMLCKFTPVLIFKVQLGLVWVGSTTLIISLADLIISIANLGISKLLR